MLSQTVPSLLQRPGAAGVLVILLLPLLAAVASAEEEDEADALYRLPSVPLGLGFGWEDGPVYGLDEPVEVRGRIGMSLDLDGGYVAGDIGVGWESAVRRARFNTHGFLRHWAGPEYRFEFSVEQSRVFLSDFYLRWHFERPWIQAARIGYFDPPMSLAALESSSAAEMMEVPAPVAAFTPGYRLGVEADGTRPAPDLTWQLGLSTVGQGGQNKGQAAESAARANGRLVWRPWHDEDGEETLLHLGLSLEYTLATSSGLRYRARPESFLVDFLVDTGEIEGNAGTTVVEGAWRQGPLSVQGEAFFNILKLEEGGSPNLWGVYVQVSRVLTGEFRPYGRKSARFGRVAPEHPFSFRERQWGAFELTGRVSWIDLDDGPIRGGRMLTASAGLVWTLTHHVRIHVDGILSYVDQQQQNLDVQVLQSRLEFRF
jgi:phosphate-selective porin OprO/OprP